VRSTLFDFVYCTKEVRDSPYKRVLVGFTQKLVQAGYGRPTINVHLRSALGVLALANRLGAKIAALDEAWVEGFARRVSQCRRPSYSRDYQLTLRHGAQLFLAHLRSVGLVITFRAQCRPPDPVLLTAFGQWMHQQRGASNATVYIYSVPIRALLGRLGHDPGRYDAQHLRQFVLDSTQSCKTAVAKRCTTALRMFLRFLIVEGKCPATLLGAIPVVAHWSLSSLPRYLNPDDIERIINTCDQSTRRGRRNRAILLLLARLGLRAGDIVQLRLNDVDWKEGWIHLSGKGRRQTRLALTHEIGAALARYLRRDRSSRDSEALFIRLVPPFQGLSSHAAVSVLVRGCMRKAGITPLVRGAAHVLRHSAATSMLQQGASLQQIATILRHESLQSTQIYAKVDVCAMRKVAQPWPRVQPC
jgi:integrase/recombinase XerD